MKIASFNVNSINARLPRILDWFDKAKPDAVVLQEIKCIDEKFPALEFEDRGYNVEVHGQKTYNGVALLSKHPVDDVTRGLPGDKDDDQARYIEALIMPDNAEPVRLGGLYLPNGNPAPGPKYDYKMKWMKRLKKHAVKLLENEEAFVLAGDYNIIPQVEDVHDPKAWADDALFLPETRAAFRELLNLGLTDSIRQANPSGVCYTFWDYQRGAWEKDNGIRIDHLLLSPQAADRFKDAGVDRKERNPSSNGEVKPSDHVPVWVELA
ncbi:exodeoxyribonuclease III [Marinicaulis aureus]|uniref:Exodeoxyribonuclease III n=1 Tax=Hyphococcus aureus TaxID=2666033 RepID=A0ABW1L1N5_9PROT